MGYYLHPNMEKKISYAEVENFSPILVYGSIPGALCSAASSASPLGSAASLAIRAVKNQSDSSILLLTQLVSQKDYAFVVTD